MALPIVAIVGRPNVGKSTLVNRIAQTGDAIVHEMRGVTRDRSYHKADWNGVEFMLIDTGGIEMGGDDAFQGSICAQAFEGAREADVIIFLVDGKAGINTDDEEVARILQKAGKPVFVAVNKMDNPARMDEVWEFYALGLGDPWPVSAQHGNGTGDLLDAILDAVRLLDPGRVVLLEDGAPGSDALFDRLAAAAEERLGELGYPVTRSRIQGSDRFLAGAALATREFFLNRGGM